MAIKKNKNGLKNFLTVIFLAVVTVGFFWQVFFKNRVPMPGDLMVGAYFPWLEEKWGYVTGVPIKNPLISDVFSTIYLWKQVVAESIKSRQWPLWNPYSYSGYPSLGNLLSGGLHPFNFLFVMLGQMNGWSAWMILSILGEVLGMYWFLKVKKLNNLASVIGAVTFGFSGFSLLWNQFLDANVAIMWWPIGFGLIEKFFETKNKRYLWWFPLIGFLIIASGHFQLCVYSVILFLSYFGYKWGKDKIKTDWKFWVILIGLTVMISLPQILPVAEMGMNSVRFDENYIKSYNFGLLPIANLITLFAPDFFGNPTTYNYWGFFNYLETNFYVGVLGFMALFWSFFNYKKLGDLKYFLIIAACALLLGFNTPVGKLIYILKVPGLSTSAAGRIASVFAFAVAVLTSAMIQIWSNIKWKEYIKTWWCVPVMVGIVGILGKIIWSDHITIILRNLAIPSVIFALFTVIFSLRKHKIGELALIAIVILDLFRFGWKWTPFVDKKMIFPSSEIIDFLQVPGGDYFRVERENGEIFPPNVWSAYHIMSPSGYDPMAPKNYVSNYEKKVNLNKLDNPGVSRYLELDNYNAAGLGEFNVKYLWVIKRDKDNKIFGNEINKNIDLSEWKKVKETKGTVLLENLKVKARVVLIDDQGVEDNQNVYIEEYKNNSVKIKYISKKDNEKLILRDSWDKGWKVRVNGKLVKVEKFNQIYRQVSVPQGSGEVEFIYFPDTFKFGLIGASAGLLIWLIGFFRLKKIESR